MNMEWSMDAFLTVSSFVGLMTLSALILRKDWRRYGLLFLVSAIVGTALCYLFVYLELYEFPYLLFPAFSKVPLTIVLSVFPFFVLFGVRYSPRRWPWKIVFYWTLVHLGVLGEAIAENVTGLIRYGPHWHVWESYTWWWIFLLVFEWWGGMIVPQGSRRPVGEEFFRFGKPGFFLVHFVLIVTIFLGGVYAGIRLK